MRRGNGNVVLIVVLHVSNFIKCTLSMRALMSFVTLKFCFLKKRNSLPSVPPVAQQVATFGEKTLACHSQFHSLTLFYTMKYHFPQMVMAEIKKTLLRGGEYMRKRDPHTCWQERKAMQLLWETVRRALKRIHTELPWDPGSSLPRCATKRHENTCPHKTLHRTAFTAAWFTRAKDRQSKDAEAHEETEERGLCSRWNESTGVSPAPRCSTLLHPEPSRHYAK